MRRVRRLAGAVVAAFALLSASLLLSGARGATAQDDPASRALLFLQAQQSETDGSVHADFPSYSPSELYAIGAAAAGYDPKALRRGNGPSVVDYLAAHAGTACASAGACGRLLQAVIAANTDPTAFGGVDVPARLMSMYSASDGAFGAGDVFTQSLAVQGLLSAGDAVPAAALTNLRLGQNANGGWGYEAFPPDTNSTAMALMTLDAAGDHSRDSSALLWLHTQQDPDAGFAYSPGTASDPDSTALVLQAVIGAGQDPSGAPWSVAGHTPSTWLAAHQDASGGFAYPGASSVDTDTTSQALPALEQAPYPVRSAYATGFTPAVESRAALSALLYLHARQSPADGSLHSDFPSYDPSELYAIGAAAAGYDPKTLGATTADPSVMDYLAANAADACSIAGACGRLIQAVVAANQNAHAFGGADLVALLMSAYTSSNGGFGAGDVFTQSLAVQGLVAAAAPVPQPALTNLRQAQASDGGWGFGSFGSDTNSTAMALMALDSAGDHRDDGSGLRWLHTQQSADGGFPSQAGSPSDAASTALVLQAIAGTGHNPAGADWSISGHTPLSWLIAEQDAGGGYRYPGQPDDTDTTAQVIPALERVPFPVPFSQRAFYVTGATLQGSSSSATPTPTRAPSSPGPTALHAGVVTPPAARRDNAPPATAQPTTASTATPAPAGGVLGTTAPTPRSDIATAQPAAPGGGLPAALVYLLIGAGTIALGAAAGFLMLRRRTAA